jgi:hypothetical protein
MDSSSVTYAMMFSFPPHWRQTSGSAWYTFAIRRAQLGGQRRLIGAASAGSSEPFFSLREARTRLA